MQFLDATCPTDDEIIWWAYARQPEPMPDWDLCLADVSHGPALVRLVLDDACPARRYLLGVLYLLVGDAVRTGYGTAPEADLVALIVRARATRDSWLSCWAERSERLMGCPSSFEYGPWCAGGLAADPL